MSKLLNSLILILCVLNLSTVYASDIPKLKFSENSDGKFIYCNNPESISRDNLSNSPNSSYIMNNIDMNADKYVIYVSHINRTAILDKNKNIIESGFDIELDVQLKAKDNTKLRINSIGFEVPKQNLQYKDNKLFQYENNWSCLNAVAGYMQRPIYELGTDKKYIPSKFNLVELDIKKGEEIWLSEYIDNYQTVAWLKPVHMIADIEILEGCMDINIAALKSNGILGDRTEHNNNAAKGIYYRDKQYKGIADTLPKVISDELNYTIDDNTEDGTLFPVKVSNQYTKDNPVTTWVTNINPQADIYSKNSSVESDIIHMYFKDESKLKYYGSNVKDKDDIWRFDVFHSDTKGYDGAETGYSSENYIPNYILDVSKDNTKFSCNLGNYGITNVYKININNKSSSTKYFNYNLTTTSSNIVNVKNKDENYIDSYSVSKSSGYEKKMDTMACVELPSNEVTNFYLEVTLPVNFPGGMENQFKITDTATEINFLENTYNNIPIVRNFTGKEFFKWYNRQFFISYDNKNWTKVKVSDEFKNIFEGSWDNYEIKCAGNKYTLRFCAYDSAPNLYYETINYYNKIYILDKNFNIISIHAFDKYPTQIDFKDGMFFVKADKEYYSADGLNWYEKN